MTAVLKKNMNATSIASWLFFLFLLIYPLFSNSFRILNYIAFMYQMLLASSLVLIWGYCGMFSFAQAAFFGLGGYCYGIIMLNIQNNAFSPVAMILSVLFGAAVAGVFGYFLFYGGVNDSFLGVTTMCFTLICEVFLQQTANPKWRIGNVRLNGFNGINNIPPFSIGDTAVTGIGFYYIVLASILIVLIALRYIRRRKIGYTIFAVRENSRRSSLLGYNIELIKTAVFAIGGSIAALAGVFYTMWGGYIVPTSMNLNSATIPIVLAAAGGRDNPIAVYIFSLLYLQFAQYMAAQGTQYAFIVLGFILIFVVLFVPNGIINTALTWIDNKIFNRFHTVK